MLRSFIRPAGLLLLLGAMFSSQAVAQPTLAEPLDQLRLKIGNYRAKYRTTWQKWNSRKQALGTATTNEVYARSNTSEGTAMRFVNGLIVRINTGPRAGRTSLVFAGIYNKYQQLGGINGSLGFPTGDPHQITNQLGNYAQSFELGQIYWNPTKNAYDVSYF